MGVAGLIGLLVVLQQLLVWSVASAMVLWLALRWVYWNSGRSGSGLVIHHKLTVASLKLAFQIFGVGIGALFLGALLAGTLNLNPSVLIYLVPSTFLLIGCYLAQRQVNRVFGLTFWRLRFLKVPLGVASQLGLATALLFGVVVSKMVWPERYERERTIYPTSPLSSQLQDIALRPGNVHLSIPTNHIKYVEEQYLPTFRQTYSQRMKTRITLEFLFPKFAGKTTANMASFEAPGSREKLLVRIFTAEGQEGLSINSEWKIWCGEERARKCGLKDSGRLSEVAGFEVGLKEYSLNGAWLYRWFISDVHLISCRDFVPPKPAADLLCEVERSMPNGVIFVYSFPFTKIAKWKEIDAFVRQTVLSYLVANHQLE